MHPRREALFTVMAWAYLLLMPWHCRLVGPLYLHDLLAPGFALAVVLRSDWRRWRHLPDAGLAAFLGLAALITLVWRPTRADIYELAVFAYMGLLYAFFSRTRLAVRGGLDCYAAVVVASFWGVGAGQLVLGLVAPHSAYVGTTLGFLATRFGYTFGNPNLFGSFVALPLAGALLALLMAPAAAGAGEGTRWWRDRLGPGWSEPLRLFWRWVLGTPPASAATPANPARGRHWLGWLALAAAFAIPALLSGSRHLLLSVALILGALPWLLPERCRRRARRLAWLGLLAVFALAYLTVLIPFFPLQSSFPFVNARTPGMYMIHQAAYLRLAGRDAGTLLAGLGQHAVRARYPQAVNPDLATRVLTEYRMEKELLPSFLVYMDAHNEYLNLAVAFGLPALLCLAVFFVALARHPAHAGPAASLLAFYLVAVAMAALWDDLLSKRWIWVTVGLLAAAARAPENPLTSPRPAAR